MCKNQLLIKALSGDEKKLLLDKLSGRYFGTKTARLAVIQSLVRLGLASREGEHPKYGSPRWALTYCGIQAGKLLVELQNYTLLHSDIEDRYEDKRKSCPIAPKSSNRRKNPTREQQLLKWGKTKVKTVPRIKAWIEKRIEQQKPITYRFVSQLVGDYAERYNIPGKWAWKHLQECGIENIIIHGPIHPDFPSRESWFRPTAEWMWKRRDLRPNPSPDEKIRKLERQWSQGDQDAGLRLQIIKRRIFPIPLPSPSDLWPILTTCVYQADAWCKDCCDAISEELIPKMRDASYEHQIPVVSCNQCDYSGPITQVEILSGGEYLCPSDEHLWGNWGVAFIDEGSYDSDFFPKGAYDNFGEADSPRHCANQSKCVNAIQIDWKIGGEPDLIGGLLSWELTQDGVDYVIEAINFSPQDLVPRLWAKLYRYTYAEIAAVIEELNLDLD